MSKFVVTTISGFEDQAKLELQYEAGNVAVHRTFFKGVLWIESQLKEKEVAERISAEQTRYVARLIPVQKKLEIPKDKSALSRLVSEVSSLSGLPVTGERFRVDCERRGEHEFSSRDVAKAIGESLEARGAVFDLENPQKIVSVQIFQSVAFVGCSPAEHFLNKKPLEARKYAPGERPFTRAYHKLKEAFEAFQLPSGGVALDIGAAPGGWSKVLLEKGFRVFAVDPASLSEELQNVPGLTHLKLRAEELLNSGFADLVDLLTFDANIPPEEAASICNQLSNLIKPNGVIVVTFKRTQPGREVVDKGLEILRQKFDVKSIKRLPHNKRELTVSAVKLS